MHWCIYEYIPLPPRQCSLTTCTATARRPTLGRRSPPPAPPPPNACSWALRRHPTACSTSSGAHAMSVLTMVIRKGMGLGGRSGVSRKQIRGGGGAWPARCMYIYIYITFNENIEFTSLLSSRRPLLLGHYHTQKYNFDICFFLDATEWSCSSFFLDFTIYSLICYIYYFIRTYITLRMYAH